MQLLKYMTIILYLFNVLTGSNTNNIFDLFRVHKEKGITMSVATDLTSCVDPVSVLSNDLMDSFPASNYRFKIYTRNTRKKCEICSKLILKPSQRHL